MIRKNRFFVSALAALVVAAVMAPTGPVSAQSASPGPAPAENVVPAEPDPEEEDRACANGVQSLAADLQKQADKGATQAAAGVLSAYRAMRAACDDYRDCRVDCRKDKRSCKAGAKSEKHACIAECAKKSGRDRRACRRNCRKDKRDDVRDCRDEKRSCKDECREELLDGDCAKGRRGFLTAMGRAQQASKGQKPAANRPDPAKVCAQLYSE